MNAHHKKAYKPALPGYISYMSDGDLRTSDPGNGVGEPSKEGGRYERLFGAVRRVPFGWEVSDTLGDLYDVQLTQGAPVERDLALDSLAFCDLSSDCIG